MQITTGSYVVLALQIVTLLMIGYGAYQMKFKRRMRRHAILLTTATAINVITVVLFMVPRFFNYLPIISTSYLPDQVLIVHHTFSLIALALTLTVVLSWALRGAKNKGCLGLGRHGRTIMRTTYGTWLVSIALGILVIILNTPF
jgi:uncharacterized membrane protein YozB (DUF420 family)